MATPKNLSKEELKKFNGLFQSVSNVRANLAEKTLNKELSLRSLEAQKHQIENNYEKEFQLSNQETLVLNSKIKDFVNEMNEKLGGQFQYNPITGEITEEPKQEK